MSAFESSYSSLLQGVSQQVPRERRPGQLTAQDNMLSDIVSNLRRRPGAEYQFDITDGTYSDSNVAAWYTDIAGQQVHVILNCTTGVVTLRNPDFTPLKVFAANEYLQASHISLLRATTVGDEFFICNVDVIPTKVTGGLDTRAWGFFYIRTAAFSKTYSVTVKNTTGQFTYSYTTPDGTTAGDAALATPEYIAGNLKDQINAGTNDMTATAEGATVGVKSTNGHLSIATTSGVLYVVSSGASNIRSASDLPATLPADLDGYIVTTGNEKAKVYYRYSAGGQEWLEDGAIGSATTITDMPISITNDGTDWVMRDTAFEGRFSGDDDTNPDPEFLIGGITGMGAYQGRLVILSGPMVALSASAKPRRFYRSTVATLADDDTIHVGASANSSAAYQYCVPFQKDLLLFSSQYQALIPSGNQALTPRTATVVLTSTYDGDMGAAPVPMGRTLMYPVPVSADFFGLNEMLPSTFTDSQYTSVNVTQHLPKYMGGRCRFGVSSSVANMALFGATGDKRALIVHEYSWDAEEKVQQAWHRWTFPYDISAAYFAGSRIVVLFVNNGHLVGCTLDPRVGFLTTNANRRPYLDLYTFADIVDHSVTIPAWLLTFDPTITSKVRLSQATGSLSGEPVGFSTDGTTLTTVRSYPSGSVAIGVPFVSAVSPTPPLVKDQNGVVISATKLTILRYLITTTGSAEYKVLVRDSNWITADPIEAGTLFWSSEELQLGQARVGADATAVVPLRTNALTTSVSIYTDGLGELNIIGLEYVCRFNQRIRRR